MNRPTFGGRHCRKGDALRYWSILSCLALAACGPYPDDIAGTSDRIERTGRLNVGLSALRPGDEPAARRFVARLERATGAKATIRSGPLESQLGQLEAGKLDLVIGEFADDSPWLVPVMVIEPLSRRREGAKRLGLSPVARNGENRWIALVQREVRDELGQARP